MDRILSFAVLSLQDDTARNIEMTSIPHYSTKIRPNEPCPCGSKKKYKKCHGHFSHEQSTNPYQLDGRLRSLTPSRQCLAPVSFAHECARGTINAHTVSRSGSLGAIERDGHVYSYNPSLQGLIKSSGKLRPELTGWRQASTFPGFCRTHDKKLFQPLEDEPFTGSTEQCFLLAYRCIAREFYAKKASVLQIPLRHAITAQSPELKQYIADFNRGVELGLRDANVHKARYDLVLEKKDWNAVHAVLIEFDGVFPIQSAGGFFPDVDVFGHQVQVMGIGRQTPEAMTLVSFAAGGKSYTLFCWLIDSDTSSSSFVSALLRIPQNQLPAVLGSLLLQRSENCHFSPNWYDGLPEDGKDWCAEQSSAGLPLVTIPPPAANAGISYFSGVTIQSITTIA